MLVRMRTSTALLPGRVPQAALVLLCVAVLLQVLGAPTALGGLTWAEDLYETLVFIGYSVPVACARSVHHQLPARLSLWDQRPRLHCFSITN